MARMPQTRVALYCRRWDGHTVQRASNRARLRGMRAAVFWSIEQLCAPPTYRAGTGNSGKALNMNNISNANGMRAIYTNSTLLPLLKPRSGDAAAAGEGVLRAPTAADVDSVCSR